MKVLKIFLCVYLYIVLVQETSGQQKLTKVAIIGNSITAGSGLTNPQVFSYPSQLGNMFTSDWQIGNFGVSGRTMLKKGDYPIWLEKKFADALNFEPNMVVIMLGTNDSKYFNWAHKADFYKDYVSMIDTFAHLPSKPEIYICFPLKVFKRLYDIDDLVIHDEIIPIIHQISLDKNVKIIDCYTPTSDKPTLFMDGIHPNPKGAHFVAEIIYTGLTGNPYKEIFDQNLLDGKEINSIGLFGGSNLNQSLASAIDGNLVSSWSFKGFPSVLSVDIGSIQPIDQFEMSFRDDKNKGIQYKIEASTDSSVWNTVIDETMRSDTVSAYSINKIPATEMRYVKLTVTGIMNGINDQIKINEFKALKYHGYFHAPAVNIEVVNTYYTTVNIIAPENVMYMSFLFYNKINSIFDVYSMTKDYSTPLTYKLKGSLNTQYLYMTNAYKDGVEVFSDTIRLKFASPVTGITQNRTDEYHFQVFPNPSSGQIKIIANQAINESVTIKVFAINGELIETIHPQGFINGNQEIFWNGTYPSGKKPVPSIYFINIEGRTIHENLKVVIN